MCDKCSALLEAEGLAEAWRHEAEDVRAEAVLQHERAEAQLARATRAEAKLAGLDMSRGEQHPRFFEMGRAQGIAEQRYEALKALDRVAGLEAECKRLRMVADCASETAHFAEEHAKKADARVALLEGLLRDMPGKTLRTESDLLATWNGGWNCCLQDIRRRAGLDKPAEEKPTPAPRLWWCPKCQHAYAGEGSCGYCHRKLVPVRITHDGNPVRITPDPEDAK